MVFDDGFDVAGHHDRTSGPTAFAGNQSACAPAFLREASDPPPNSGLADTKLPDCITDTALQASGAAEIRLYKRSKDRCLAQRLSTNIATFFVITFYRCQPSNPVNPVSALTARMSDLKARYHI